MLNQIALVGRLTKEVERLNTNNGGHITNFSIAFNQGKNPDGTENTGFIDVKTFDKLALTCGEWLSKGDKVALVGKINFRKFVRKDGSKGVAYEIIASDVEFIDIIKTSEEDVEEPNEEELPFEPAPEVKVPPKEAKPVAKAPRSRR